LQAAAARSERERDQAGRSEARNSPEGHATTLREKYDRACLDSRACIPPLEAENGRVRSRHAETADEFRVLRDELAVVRGELHAAKASVAVVRAYRGGGDGDEGGDGEGEHQGGAHADPPAQRGRSVVRGRGDQGGGRGVVGVLPGGDV
jgi:hypothetical protein